MYCPRFVFVIQITGTFPLHFKKIPICLILVIVQIFILLSFCRRVGLQYFSFSSELFFTDIFHHLLLLMAFAFKISRCLIFLILLPLLLTLTVFIISRDKLYLLIAYSDLMKSFSFRHLLSLNVIIVLHPNKCINGFVRRKVTYDTRINVFK